MYNDNTATTLMTLLMMTTTQALSGFLFVVTCDGEVFYASHTVEQYLGFHQSDIIHQSALELIHSEDREQFKFQLNWQQQLTGETSELTLNRLFCQTLEICGKIKALLGQNTKGKDVPLALFALCCPFGPLPLADVPSRDYTFKSKHKMDMSPISMDPKGRMVFDYSDQELLQKGGYDLIHPDDLNYFAAAHQELIKTGSSGLIAYRLMTKDFHWIWLQTSSRVIYKNSKPDFILCIHRHLTEDEGRDLVRKRGSEFKLPYPIIDCDPSEFGVMTEEEVGRIRSPRGKKSKGQLRDYLQTGRKRKVPYRDLYSAQFNATYNNTVAYYGCSGGDVKTESMYPYTGSNLAFDTNFYRTGYHTLCSSLPGTTSDGLGSEMERHYSRYYLEPRQCQLELPYHSTGYYSDLLAQRSSKYNALDVAKPGFDRLAAGYGLDLSAGRGHYEDEISRYETDFRKYPYVGDKAVGGLIDSSALLPGCIYGTQNSMINTDGLLSCGTMPLITNSQLSLYRTDFGTAFDCYPSCIVGKNGTSSGASGSLEGGGGTTMKAMGDKYSNTYKKASPNSKSINAANNQSVASLPSYPTDGGAFVSTSGLPYSPGGAAPADNLAAYSASWPVSSNPNKLPPEISTDDGQQLRQQVSVVKQTNLFTSSPATGSKHDSSCKTSLDQNGSQLANHGNALGGVATSVIQLSGRNRRCKADDVVVSTTNPIVKTPGWHNSSTSGAGVYGCSPVFSSLYSNHEKSLQDNSDASSSYRTDRNTMYDSTGLYVPRSVVEPPKVVCFGESW